MGFQESLSTRVLSIFDHLSTEIEGDFLVAAQHSPDQAGGYSHPSRPSPVVGQMSTSANGVDDINRDAAS